MPATCPHCAAPNAEESQFCQACGKALPEPESAGPWVVGETVLAKTAPGRKLQADDLLRKARRASGLLLVIAVLQGTYAGVIYATATEQAAVVVWGLAGLSFVNVCLCLWASGSPLPPAIIGFALYLTLLAVNITATVSSGTAPIAQDRAVEGGAVAGAVCLIAAIVLGFMRAISAGIAHRRLLQQAAQL